MQLPNEYLGKIMLISERLTYEWACQFCSVLEHSNMRIIHGLRL